jgi:type VI secretion system protein ImpK
MAVHVQTSFLLPYVQDFYYELLRQKEKALRLGEVTMLPPSAEETLMTDAAVQADAINLVTSIQRRLRQVLDEQEKQATLHVGSTFSMVHFRDMHYAMAVLADETFLNLSWNGARAWRDNMLETQLFASQVAGELIFKKIDALLESHEPITPELATVYLLILSFSFRGKYKDDSDNKIRWYMDQLYLLANDGLPNRLGDSHRRLVESCYDYTLTEPPLRGLPDVRTWAMWIGGVLLVYTLITYVVWYKLSADIHESLNLIFEQAKASPLV